MQDFTQSESANAGELQSPEQAKMPADTYSHYQSTNKVNLLRFIPLLLLSFLVTGVMSFMLLIADMYYYLFIIFPILLALPILGMLYVLIHVGQCRNRIVAVVAGMLLVLQYYLGFWTLGYMAFIGYQGRQAGTQILVAETGSSGIWGYFKYHCKSNIIEDTNMPSNPEKQPDAFDRYSSYVFYGVELAILLLLGFVISKNLSRRVFYEHRKKWARRKSVRFLPSDLPKLLQTVYSGNWGKLNDMTKFSKFGNQQTACVELTVEHCKGRPDEPVYLSVTGVGLKKVARQHDLTAKGLLEKTFLRQSEVPGSVIYELHRVLPGFKLLSEAAANNASLPHGEFAVAEARHQSRFAAMTKPVKDGKVDFRQVAVKESQSLLGYQRNTPLNTNISFCLPVEPEEQIKVKSVAFFPLFFSLLALVSIFSGLGVALWGAETNLPESDEITPMGYVLIALGICIFLSSFFFLFFSKPLHIRRMKRLFLRRSSALFDERTTFKLLTSNIEDGKTYHVFKFAPEDVGLVCLDTERQRLLIEGCAHRYVIYGKDVEQIETIKNFSENVVIIGYQIGKAKLTLTLTSESLKKAFVNQTIFGLIKGRSSQKFMDEFKNTLGLTNKI